MKDNRWTLRSTEWQIKGARSFGRPKRHWRDGIVGQQGTVWTRIGKDRESWRTLANGMDKDWKGQRKLEDSGGGLLPAVEGHSLEYNRTEWNGE